MYAGSIVFRGVIGDVPPGRVHRVFRPRKCSSIDEDPIRPTGHARGSTQKSLHGGSERKTLASAFEIPSTILGPECGSGVDEGTDYTIPPIRSPVYDTIRNQPRTGSVVLVAEHGMMLCGDLIYYYLCKSNTFLLIVNSIRFECR
jgi:hypothetical protein